MTAFRASTQLDYVVKNLLVGPGKSLAVNVTIPGQFTIEIDVKAGG
jgi:hypothetical protein